MADFPLINGVHASWANFRIKLKGSNFVFASKDIKGLSWGDAVAVELIRGQGGMPRGRTEGEYTAEDVVMEVYRDSAREFQLALQAIKPKISLVHFDIFCGWEPYEDADALNEVRIAGLRVTGRKTGMAPGAEGAFTEFTLSAMYVEEDGVRLL